MKQLIQIFILTATLLTISCGENGKQKTEQIPTIVETKYLADTTKFFIEFWQTLRQAIINNDTNKIIASTAFPFETRGPQDSDPIINYERKNFIRMFTAFLKQPGYLETELDDIKKTLQPDTTYINNTWARVGDLEFNNRNGQWKLTFAYLMPGTINELKK
jgi:hypothetical protein